MAKKISDREDRSPDDIAKERIAKARRNAATALDLSGLTLTALPEAVAELTSLQTLNLSRNELTEAKGLLRDSAPLGASKSVKFCEDNSPQQSRFARDAALARRSVRHPVVDQRTICRE